MRKYLFILFYILFSILSASSLVAQTDPAWVFIGRAKRAIAQNKSADALNLLNKVIIIYPEVGDSYYLLAEVYQSQAGEPSSPGGVAAYTMAISQYEKTIMNAKNLIVPAYELDSYFKLLDIYEKLVENDKYLKMEMRINELAVNEVDDSDRGRIYFRLASHYTQKNQNLLSLENYNLSYKNGYRRKISLFRTSLIYRKMRNYSEEKRTLLLATRYDFEHEEPINFDVQKAIISRLDELTNVKVPDSFY